jgi:DNA-binding YbaB/EbfC family protein
MLEKIKQLKQLRDQAQAMKQALAQATVSADAAHGKVSVVMDGNQEVLAVNIDQALLSPDKKEDLEKIIKAATNDAVKKSRALMAQKVQSMGGFNLPNL